MLSITLMIAFLAAGHVGTNAEQLDVAFLVDGSPSICSAQPCPNWGYILQFICDIVGNLTIGPDNSRIAFFTISEQPLMEWDFKKYTDKALLLSAIQNVAYPGGDLKMAISFDFAINSIFSAANGDRQFVQNVVVGITDGSPKIDATIQYGYSTAFQNNGGKVLLVCVMPGCSESFAQGLASPPKQVGETYFLVPDFKSLRLVKEKLLHQILAS